MFQQPPWTFSLFPNHCNRLFVFVDSQNIELCLVWHSSHPTWKGPGQLYGPVTCAVMQGPHSERVHASALLSLSWNLSNFWTRPHISIFPAHHIVGSKWRHSGLRTRFPVNRALGFLIVLTSPCLLLWAPSVNQAEQTLTTCLWIEPKLQTRKWKFTIIWECPSLKFLKKKKVLLDLEAI